MILWLISVLSYLWYFIFTKNYRPLFCVESGAPQLAHGVAGESKSKAMNDLHIFGAPTKCTNELYCLILCHCIKNPIH